LSIPFADNGSSARAFVLGNTIRKLSDVDLLTSGMMMTRNGAVVFGRIGSGLPRASFEGRPSG